jgi:predicted TIM-barrel fold metal-dependent hydrolase
VIFDGHCHIWENWPYQPPPPDVASRARAEQLLYEMDANGVECAIVICARLGDNAGNVDYAFEAAQRHRGRLIVFPDLECKWAADYSTPCARDRLADALGRWQFAGFTTYLDEAEDGSWLTSDEGLAFFALAAERKLIASLSVIPHQAPAVTALAVGPTRMIWGSDYPVSRRHMTYRQTIRLLERHGPFQTDDLPLVMGGNLQRLLAAAMPPFGP